jgi:peroxiredoxin
VRFFRDSIDGFNAKGAVVLGISQGTRPSLSPPCCCCCCDQAMNEVETPGVGLLRAFLRSHPQPPLVCVASSPDSVESHRKFRAQHDLPFNLLSDLTVLTTHHLHHAPSPHCS